MAFRSRAELRSPCPGFMPVPSPGQGKSCLSRTTRRGAESLLGTLEVCSQKPKSGLGSLPWGRVGPEERPGGVAGLQAVGVRPEAQRTPAASSQAALLFFLVSFFPWPLCPTSRLFLLRHFLLRKLHPLSPFTSLQTGVRRIFLCCLPVYCPPPASKIWNS